MAFERNVGGRDRLLRGILALVLAVVALASVLTGRRTMGLLTAVVAVGLALNYITCFCSLNRLLGLDTTEDE